MKRWLRGTHTAFSQPTESEGLSSQPPPQWLRSPPGHTLILASLICVLQELLAFWPRAQGLRFSVY